MEQELKQLEFMLRANTDMVRMVKRGFFPASVAASVQPAINYLNNLSQMTKQRISQLQTQAKNAATKVTDSAQPMAASEPQVSNDQATK